MLRYISDLGRLWNSPKKSPLKQPCSNNPKTKAKPKNSRKSKSGSKIVPVIEENEEFLDDSIEPQDRHNKRDPRVTTAALSIMLIQVRLKVPQKFSKTKNIRMKTSTT